MTKFQNRKDAGEKLAEKLKVYLEHEQRQIPHKDLVVVGLPRGGVIVALEVARKFGCQIDILASKKITYPTQPEYAIGAVTSDGEVVLNPDIPDTTSWEHYVEEQRQMLLHQTKEMEGTLYDKAGYIANLFENKIVIIVDDGVATGMTAIAAIETARQRGAKMIIMAAPIMSIESHHEISKFCGHVVASAVHSDFMSVGQYYDNFQQTTSEEVVDAMRESHHFAPQSDMSFILQWPKV